MYDPELFASILRVRPRFMYRHYHRICYTRIKPHREIALKRLLQALKVVVPEYAAGIKDVVSIRIFIFKSVHVWSFGHPQQINFVITAHLSTK